MPRTSLLLALLLLATARCLFAAGPPVAVLGTGSATGAVVAAHPSATGTGGWFHASNTASAADYLACQVSAMGTNTITIEGSLDNTNADTLTTFTADKQIKTIPVTAGISYRAVVSAYTSGSPVVKCTVSGSAQIVVVTP